MRRDFELVPSKSALLVIDMQRHFCDPASRFYVPQSDILAGKLHSLAELFDRSGRPVIFTRHIDSSQPDNLMLRWWSEKIRIDDPASQIVDVFDAEKSVTVIKNQYDGFLHTDLERILRQKDVRQVVVCGVLTNLCCETTARSAFMRGFEVYFVKDGTATFSPEMHDAALLNLAYGFAVVTTLSDVTKTIGRE
jgi:bifunctional isochorismate lyase / aryl carrier protein